MAFALGALARGAEALGGVGEGKRDEEREYGSYGEEVAPERNATGPIDLDTKKATRLRGIAELWPGVLMGWEGADGEIKFYAWIAVPRSGTQRDSDILPYK